MNKFIYLLSSTLICCITSLEALSQLSEGPNSPTLFSQSSGGGTVVWVNEANVDSSDDAYATYSGGSFGTISYLIEATGFGFNIPPTAIVEGIIVEIEKKQISGGGAGAGNIADYTVRLLKNGINIGSNKADVLLYWPSADTYVSYGSAIDLWGTSWTASDINSSGFGIQLAASTGGTAAACIDHMQITVFYNIPTLIDDIKKQQPYNLNIIKQDESLKLDFYIDKTQSLKLSVFNSLGQEIIYKELGELNEGNYQENISINQLPGIYFIKLQGLQSEINKFFIIK